MGDDSRVLIVRHLPKELAKSDWEDFLKYFGASQVRCFGDRGRMKHVAVATFEGHEAAKHALKRLHQLEVLGSRLTVEFSNVQMSIWHPSELPPLGTSPEKDTVSTTDDQEQETRTKQQKAELIRDINSIPCKGVEYPYNPKLQYLYPSPTVSILTNIANALASVPRFYVQVLHLMNKMNLPAPFGPVTATPPIAEGPPPLPSEPPNARPAEPSGDEDLSSDEGSEIDSDEVRAEINMNGPPRPRKRAALDPNKPKKRHKLQKIAVAPSKGDLSYNIIRPEDMFEQPQGSAPRKIELRLPAAITSTPGLSTYHSTDLVNFTNDQILPNEQPFVPPHIMETPPPQQNAAETTVETTLETEPNSNEGGFGKIEPMNQDQTQSSSEGETEEWGATRFISSRSLSKGRLSRSQMKELSVFKNYKPGDPTTRLYVKNLAKQTTEKDLHYIFGKYVDWENDIEKLMFDIRLMKEGRMKGQAFITLPNEKSANMALEDTNTFILNNKPMVVQFARSAKSKDVDSVK